MKYISCEAIEAVLKMKYKPPYKIAIKVTDSEKEEVVVSEYFSSDFAWLNVYGDGNILVPHATPQYLLNVIRILLNEVERQSG